MTRKTRLRHRGCAAVGGCRAATHARRAAVAALIAGAGLVSGAHRPLVAQQSRALRVLKAASARYAAAHTVCSNFTQKLDVTLLKETRTGTGRLCREQPDRFAMRFTRPKGDAVVMDGSAVWIYYRSVDSTQVMKYPVTRAPGGYDFQQQFLTDPASKYTVTYEGRERVVGRLCHRIRLVPKGDMSFKSAELWVDASDFLIRQLRVVDENESVRTVTLLSVEIDPKVSPSWFRFTPPPGVRVISPGVGSGG